LAVSVAGLGCNNFGMRIDEDRAHAVVHAALEAGITFFDTARMYGGGQSEGMLGRALAGHRGDVVLATKFGSWNPADAGGSRRVLMESVETSLTELGTDYIDLYQFHFPDPATPLEETIGAMSALVDQGKVRYIGCSNFAGWMVAHAHGISLSRGFEPFVSVQNEWSLLSRSIEDEVLDACREFGLGVIPFFPLASGFLTGKVRRGDEVPSDSRLTASHFAHVLVDSNFDKVERLEEWARKHDMELLDVALSWLASQSIVASVIAGATTPEQVRRNAAATRTDLTPEQVAEIGDLVGR
jgi:aryl-alcohol dehydrogenase-like predicted oxidoreductase